MKKLPLLFAIAILASPFVVAAATAPTDFVPLAPIPGLTEGVNTTSASMALFLNNIYKLLLGFAAIAAVIMIIWGGLQYATTDSIGNKSEGRAKIQQAVLGLILVLMPVLVFSIINPNILNLSVNWKPIALPTNLGPTNPGGGVLVTTPVSGGVILLDGEYLKKANFTTNASTGAFIKKCTDAGLIVRQACQKDPTGSCTQTTSIVCHKESTFLRYQLKKDGFLAFYEDRGVIPRDLGLANEFAQKCSASSGIVEKESDSWLNAEVTWSFGTGCPANAGFTINPPYSSARCTDDVWMCIPN